MQFSYRERTEQVLKAVERFANATLALQKCGPSKALLRAALEENDRAKKDLLATWHIYLCEVVKGGQHEEPPTQA